MIPNTGGGATSTLDMKTIGELAPILFNDRQARSGLMPPWAAGKSAKEYRATMGRKPIGGIFSVGVEEAYRWKDSVQSEAEVRIWVADGIANGMRPWFTKFSGTLHDRALAGHRRGHLHMVSPRSRHICVTRTPLARVGLVYSQQTGWFYGGPRARAKVEDHLLGWYQALIEARIPFEMVHDRLLDAEHLDRIEDADLAEHRRPLRRAVPAAPRVRGAGRGPGGDVRDLAVRRVGSPAQGSSASPTSSGSRSESKAEGPMRNAYLRLEDDPRTGKRHPLLDGLDDAHADHSRHLPPGARAPARLPEPAPDPHPQLSRLADGDGLPARRTDRGPRGLPELRSARVGSCTFPGTSTASSGKCWPSITASCSATPSAGRPMRIRPVEVKGPGVLDVSVWRQQQSMTVHLVNLTNPMMMKGPFRELIPVGEQQVVVRLPAGARARRVQLLRAGRVLPVPLEGDRMSLKIPSIRDHEIVAIDLE